LTMIRLAALSHFRQKAACVASALWLRDGKGGGVEMNGRSVKR